MDDSTRSGRITFQALFELYCECTDEDDCACLEADDGEKYHWEAKTIELPKKGIHLVECCERETCLGCWVWQLDGPLPLYWWMVETLGAEGGQVLVDGKAVDVWTVYQ